MRGEEPAKPEEGALARPPVLVLPRRQQPLDAARKADLLKRSGKFATRVMHKANVPEKEMKRLMELTDEQGEEEVRREHEAATAKSMKRRRMENTSTRV